MKLSEIIGVIEKWAPKKHAEDFDNVDFWLEIQTLKLVKDSLLWIQH